MLLAAAVHLGYSWIGFVATDEGYLLTGSRRLLDGQLPYRDYISLRPIGAHLLHAHFLLWAGERLIWWTRIAEIVELAICSWLWTRLTERHIAEFSRIERWAVASLGLLASIGVQQLKPWSTVDGITFVTLGIAAHRLSGRRLLGLVLIGCSVLFRQNFLLPFPIYMLCLGEFLSVAAWAALLLPGLMFTLWLVATGTFWEALGQMTGRGDFLGQVLSWPFDYYIVPITQGLAAGAAGFLLGGCKRRSLRIAGAAVLASAFCYAVFLIPFDGSWGNCGFFLLYALAGGVCFFRKSVAPAHALLVMALSFAAAISAGPTNPLFACSALLPTFAGLVVLSAANVPTPRAVRLGVVLFAVLIGATGFHLGRRTVVWNERSAIELTSDLGDVLAGGRGIFTNEMTYAYLRELSAVTDELRSRRRTYAILPESAQFWVTSPQPNPLSSDWPQDGEIRGFENRLIAEIDGLHGHGTIVVQKYRCATLSAICLPISERESLLIQHVKSHFRRVSTGDFIELYE